MAAEKLTSVELESIRLLDSKARTVPSETLVNFDVEEDVSTPFGPLHVVAHGDRRLPVILTYHDIGLNSTSCFQGFFNYPDMQTIMKSFCVYHLNALGQHEGALTLPQGYVYPTMDEMAQMILAVVDHFKPGNTITAGRLLGWSDLFSMRIRTFIGFGVGAGANIVSRFALLHPERMDALVLINCNASQAGWIEWGYQKWNAWYLKSGMMTSGVEEYLLWHWFGNKTMETNYDLVNVYSEYIKSLNPVNLGHFVSSYIGRTDLGITRELDPTRKANVKNFTCPVMLVAGDNSPHLDDTVEMNGRLDPSNSNWMKFECGGMILEEAPGKVSEAFRLFLQGMGYVPLLKPSSETHRKLSAPVLNSLSTSKVSLAPQAV